MRANRQLGLVVKDRTWHSAEELETDLVPFAEGFGALRRIGLHQTTIAVRQIHREEMDLALLTSAISASASPKSTCACQGSGRSGTNTSRSRCRRPCT